MMSAAERELAIEFIKKKREPISKAKTWYEKLVAAL